MSFNGSGQFVLNSGGLPYVTGTTISSTTANNLNTDLASGLSTCITKDGQTTVTANLPMATFRHTNVGAATARTDYARASQVQDSALILIGSIAGTNTITGSLSPAITAYAAGQFYTFIPANTNTGATTININSVGARNIFWNGAACVGGELRQNIPCAIYDDGTQMHIVGNGFNAPFLDTHAVVEGSADSTKKLRFEVDGLTTATTRVLTPMDADYTIGERLNLGTVSTTTGGTTITFSGLPTGIRAFSLDFFGMSLSGTDDLLLQLSQAATFATSAYVSTSNIQAGGGSNSANKTSTAGAITEFSSAATVFTGRYEGRLINPSTNLWSISHSGIINTSGNVFHGFTTIALAGALDGIRIKTTTTDTIDVNGGVNISYLR